MRDHDLAASGYERANSAVPRRRDPAAFPPNTFDTLVVDLPTGMLHGTRRENETFYPAVLAEAARVATPGALFVGITTSKRVFDAASAEVASAWTSRQTYPLKFPSAVATFIRPSLPWSGQPAQWREPKKVSR